MDAEPALLAYDVAAWVRAWTVIFAIISSIPKRKIKLDIFYLETLVLETIGWIAALKSS